MNVRIILRIVSYKSKKILQAALEENDVDKRNKASSKRLEELQRKQQELIAKLDGLRARARNGEDTDAEQGFFVCCLFSFFLKSARRGGHVRPGGHRRADPSRAHAFAWRDRSRRQGDCRLQAAHARARQDQRASQPQQRRPG